MDKQIRHVSSPLVIGVHPGEILQEELNNRGLSQTEFARHIRVHPKVINEICRGRRGISVEMAIKFSFAFGTSSDLWIGLQKDYELSHYNTANYRYIQKLSA